MRKLRWILCFMLAVAAHGATGWAADAPPPEVAKVIARPTPYGEGKLQRLMLVAYKAALWTDAERWSYAKPFALSITYEMGFTRDELVERTLSEMAQQQALSAAQTEDYRAQLNKVFTEVKDGDRFTALMPKKGTVRFYHNGRAMGEIMDADFATRFFDIWLSQKTSEPSLRRGLLALNE